MIDDFQSTINPQDVVPRINEIAKEIISLFIKYRIDEAQSILVLSQVIGAVAIRAHMRKK